MLIAEWIDEIKAFRLYDEKYPTRTIAFVDDNKKDIEGMIEYAQNHHQTLHIPKYAIVVEPKRK